MGATTLRDFTNARRQQVGALNAVIFDQEGQSTAVLWTNTRQGASVQVRATATAGDLVDATGKTQTVTAQDGWFTVQISGATCDRAICDIGGMPRLLVQVGPANQVVMRVPPARATASSRPYPRAGRYLEP